jgi:hypothetical protein
MPPPAVTSVRSCTPGGRRPVLPRRADEEQTAGERALRTLACDQAGALAERDARRRADAPATLIFDCPRFALAEIDRYLLDAAAGAVGEVGHLTWKP